MARRRTGRVLLRLGWGYVGVVGAAVVLAGLVARAPDGSGLWSAGFDPDGLGDDLVWLSPGLLLTASGGLMERRRYRRLA